jgi:DNA replication protein DnaC
MICDSVEGYNSTLFAYGATGTGKSFSMIGSDREDGIMQRAIHDIFDLIEQVYLYIVKIHTLNIPVIVLTTRMFSSYMLGSRT